MEKKRPKNQKPDKAPGTVEDETQKLGKWRLNRLLKSLYFGELTILNPPEKAKHR